MILLILRGKGYTCIAFKYLKMPDANFASFREEVASDLLQCRWMIPNDFVSSENAFARHVFAKYGTKFLPAVQYDMIALLFFFWVVGI